MTALYDYEQDPGALASAKVYALRGGTTMDWLEETDDGVKMAKVDSWEAGEHDDHWMPNIATEYEAEAAAQAVDDSKRWETNEALVEVMTLLDDAGRLDVTDVMATTAIALDILRGARVAKAALAAAEREAVGFLADVLPRGTAEIDGYGPVTVSSSASRTGWDRSALVAATAAVIADRLGYPVQYIRQAIDEFLGFTTPSSWKVTALKEVGIDPDEYCRTEWRPSVVVEKDR